jgi:ppGpp synthetase/RelA/SpoT-type nucleotidyltranferase
MVLILPESVQIGASISSKVSQTQNCTPDHKRDHIPESEWEFGFFGHHYVLHIPPGVVPDGTDKPLIPSFFEMQVKTLYQHAWSEAGHDLVQYQRKTSDR